MGGEDQTTAGYLVAASPDCEGHHAVGNRAMCDTKKQRRDQEVGKEH